MDERPDLDRRISNAVSPLHGHWYASVLLCFCCLSVRLVCACVCMCVHVCACVCLCVLVCVLDRENNVSSK